VTGGSLNHDDGFVTSGGLRLHYQAWGPSTAAGTLVLVHGLGSSCHIWDLTGPLLADASHRIVAVDQRGHGESEQPASGYDFESVVADLAGFADAMGLDQPSVVVGHSWGASVVLHFAVAHPDRTAGVVLVDGGTASPGERWTWEESEARLTPPDIDGQSWADLRSRMTRNNGGAYVDPRAEAVGRSLFNVDAEGRVQRRFRIPNHMQVVRALWEQRPAELLPRVTCPVLILPARQSSDAPDQRSNKVAAVERALELQPQASVRWFEDTVHDVPLQRPEELAGELRAFAQRVLSAGAANKDRLPDAFLRG
jgi:pimeloyl-ACP methyl ester carboxylesterase